MIAQNEWIDCILYCYIRMRVTSGYIHQCIALGFLSLNIRGVPTTVMRLSIKKN